MTATCLIILAFLDLFASAAFGQSALLESNLPRAGTAPRTVAGTTNSPPPAVDHETATNAWSFSASVLGYFVHDSRDYAQPTLTADRGFLHLEARYNYEALETGSTWLGCNFGAGEKLAWELRGPRRSITQTYFAEAANCSKTEMLPSQLLKVTSLDFPLLDTHDTAHAYPARHPCRGKQ